MSGTDLEGPIGLLDSGVGGLTVLKEFVSRLPEEDIVYYGDTLHLPYGPRELSEVRTFVEKIIDFLLVERNIKAIVLACNTATSASLEMVKKNYDLPVFGTITSATEKAIKVTENNKIGVIGTEGTINSQVYQKDLMKNKKDLEVYSVACPPFVELVEEGKFEGPKVDEMVRKYLAGLKSVNIDVLILGCTHYPYLVGPIQKFFGDNVVLLSSAVEMAQEARKVLGNRGLLQNNKQNTGIRKHEFIVSDKDKISHTFLKKGRKFLQLPSLSFREINVFDSV